MKKVPTVKQEWEDFKQKIIPAGAPEIQVQEMRRAFYAGALILLGLVATLSEEAESEESGAEELDKLDKELKDFFSKVGKDFWVLCNSHNLRDRAYP